MASKEFFNNLVKKDYIIIPTDLYREAFVDYNGTEESRDEDYIKFDNIIGLKYVGMSNYEEYKFILKNRKKWFLSKIKYGF